MLLALACEAGAKANDDCSDRVARMREGLATSWDRAEAPDGVADWVPAVYRDFRRASDPVARAKLLDDAVGRTIDGCYGLADAFREAADARAGTRRAVMMRVVPEALESCRCRGVDVESLGFLLRLSPSG
jgi:hypothetical protein